jgi:hypothetical protein
MLGYVDTVREQNEPSLHLPTSSSESGFLTGAPTAPPTAQQPTHEGRKDEGTVDEKRRDREDDRGEGRKAGENSRDGEGPLDPVEVVDAPALDVPSNAGRGAV